MITAHQIGADLIKALGLPSMTRCFTLNVRHGELVTVTCEYFPEDGSFIPVLANYFLTPRAERQEAAPMNFDAWMRARTEQAHRSYMERTKHLPPCVRRTYLPEEIAAFYGVRSHGGID